MTVEEILAARPLSYPLTVPMCASVSDGAAVAIVCDTSGDGGPAAKRGRTPLGGRIPVNPSGGVESKGHPLAATGWVSSTNSRHSCAARQVADARVAVAENGGFHSGKEAVTIVTLPGH